MFLFGDIVTAVASTARTRLDPGHFRNCGAPWPPIQDIRDCDILGYARIWYDWLLDPKVPVLAVRYEMLGEREGRERIEEWTGRRIDWLSWLGERDTTVTPEDRARIERTYVSLIRAVDGAPDIFLVAKDRKGVPA